MAKNLFGAVSFSSFRRRPFDRLVLALEDEDNGEKYNVEEEQTQNLQDEEAGRLLRCAGKGRLVCSVCSVEHGSGRQVVQHLTPFEIGEEKNDRHLGSHGGQVQKARSVRKRARRRTLVPSRQSPNERDRNEQNAHYDEDGANVDVSLGQVHFVAVFVGSVIPRIPFQLDKQIVRQIELERVSKLLKLLGYTNYYKL